MVEPKLKAFRIKNGVVQRSIKDYETYQKELVEEKLRLEKFRQEDADEYKIRQQNNVIKECEVMIPDSFNRLKEAVLDLAGDVEAEDDDAILVASEIYQKSVELVIRGKSIVSA